MGSRGLRSYVRPAVVVAAACLVAAASGCHLHQRRPAPVPVDAPRELAKVPIPEYVIEPPDRLVVDATRVIPKPPYRVEPLDALHIHLTGVLEKDPVAGVFPVEPDGRVNLGPTYGTVAVAGMTIDEARDAILKHLKRTFAAPAVVVSLAESRARQQIRGEHLVRPDGTVGLGVYGDVPVVGLTLREARLRIEAHLSAFLVDPEVSVDVLAYNSKVYYVVFDGGGYGQQIARLPFRGNETVLDAVSELSGLPYMSSKYHIWVARPGPDGSPCGQVLPVDWPAVTACGSAATNYQLYPGDRIYVQADRLVATDNFLAKLLSPVERVFGVTLLGSSAVRSLTGQQQGQQFP